MHTTLGIDRYNVSVGELTISLVSKTVTFKGVLIQVEGFEYKILEYLMLRNGSPATYDVLVEHLSREGERIPRSTIRSLVSRWRARLGAQGMRYLPPTKRGGSYRLCAPKIRIRSSY